MATAGGLFVRVRPRLDDQHIHALEELFTSIARACEEVVQACHTYREAFEKLELDPGAEVDFVEPHPPV